MYNAKLNGVWIQRLREYLYGKRVIIVGNSHSMMNKKYGEFIDSFDVVVRFGKGHPTKEVSEYIGNKFDIWITGSLRIGEYKRFNVQPKFKVYNLQQLAFYDSTGNLNIPKSLFYDSDFQLYRDYFLLGDFSLHKKIVNWGYETPASKDRRMANGVMSAIWMMMKFPNMKECHAIGFDFMKSTVTYERNGRKVTCGSWHLPYSKFPSDEWDPHDSASDEYAMMKLRDKKGLIFHEMNHDSVDLEQIEKISKRYRPDLISVEQGPGRKMITPKTIKDLKNG